MTLVLRAAAIYLFLMLILRLSGKRTVGEMTAFDLILVLVISETTQQALIGEDFSLTAAMVAVVTLVGIDVLIGWLAFRFKRVERVVDGGSVVIVEHGKPLVERLAKEHVTTDEILSAARQAAGIERMDQIKFAVLESSGEITVIPMPEAPQAGGEDVRTKSRT